MLSIFVEGDSDRRFFETLLVPRFEVAHGTGNVHVFIYAEDKPSKTSSLVASAAAAGDYLFVSDLDAALCVSGRKALITLRYPTVQAARIRIVRQEIEGWYTSVLPQAEILKISPVKDGSTNHLLKEHVERYCKARKLRRVPFLLSLLAGFDVAVARSRNASLDYVLAKDGIG